MCVFLPVCQCVSLLLNVCVCVLRVRGRERSDGADKFLPLSRSADVVSVSRITSEAAH